MDKLTGLDGDTMIRENNVLYCNGDSFARRKKEYSDDAESIKKELRRLRHQLTLALENGNVGDDEINRIYDDIDFWNNEMSKFSSLSSHKTIKRKVKRYNHDSLKKLIISEIELQKKNNHVYVTIENIAYKFHAKLGDIKKIFMELNREGVISQAYRGFPHDSHRISGELHSPYVASDWISNFYYIY